MMPPLRVKTAMAPTLFFCNAFCSAAQKKPAVIPPGVCGDDPPYPLLSFVLAALLERRAASSWSPPPSMPGVDGGGAPALDAPDHRVGAGHAAGCVLAAGLDGVDG